ncbi:MAG: flagellar filament capping protein FliD [Provencibacterium sp.]|jgi:flagellar capping protein FliD|nr:flagellar filament capping protein FliD [Provencibacterium sp.]
MKIESSSSSYVNGSYASKGFSGLASGLDTESMVKELLSGTQSKIDKQEGLKQQLQWKQEIYRSIIQDLLDFKNKYFDRTSTKSLLSSGLYNAMTAVSNSSAVKVSASSSAAAGSISVEVAQLATSTVIKSAGRVSGSLSGKMDSDALQSLLANAKDGQFSLQVDYNGVKKTITLDADKISDEESFVNELQAGIQKAHGTGIKVSLEGGRISFKGSDSGQQITLTGSSDVMKAMGMKSGQSNKINGTMKLKDIGFSTPLQGGQFSFEINGTQFSYSEDATLNQVISDINSSAAGVRLTFSSMADTFTLESTETGSGFDITMSQSEGNLLSALFGAGASAGSKVSGDVLTTKSITTNGSVSNIKDDLSKATFAFTVDGVKQTITLPKRSEEDGGAYKQDEIIDLLNEELDKRFNGDIRLSESGGSVSLEINGGQKVSFDKSSGADTDIAFALGFSTKEGGKNNLAVADTRIGDLSDAQQEQLAALGFTDETKVLSNLSGRYFFNAETGRITLDSTVGDSAISAAEQEVFGIGASLGDGTVDLSAQTTQGQNAVVNIDGVWTERSSNSFSANGIYFDLKATTGSYEIEREADGSIKKNADGELSIQSAAGASNTPVTIETERNTDQIYDKITDFVNDYNTLIEKLNGYIDEDASYKDYAPLTSDQKKEMSEREIELWEEKAKEGLLRRDSTISTFLTQMRQALYERPAGSSIALYDIGIETSSSWRDKGKLVIDETKLRNAIEQNPTEVMNLFNNKDGGVATRINDILYKTANDTSGSPGTLVQIAGMKNRVSDSNNQLYTRMKQIDSQIERLKNQYEQQKTRYWNQFNAMEQMIANMNQQSAWLSQQLG